MTAFETIMSVLKLTTLAPNQEHIARLRAVGTDIDNLVDDLANMAISIELFEQEMDHCIATAGNIVQTMGLEAHESFRDVLRGIKSVLTAVF